MKSWVLGPNEELVKGMHMILRAAVLVSLLSTFCFAQDRGTITGSVTDALGGAIVEAKVTIRNPATNLRQEVATNAEGTYTVPYLPAGIYTVQAEKPNAAYFV